MINPCHPDSTASHYSVLIVGGGFSGAVLAAHLAWHADEAVSVLVLDRNPARGRGVAYGTQCGGHLLNVPAGNMSAFCDDPEHFVRWAQAHYDRAVTASRFLPRRITGSILTGFWPTLRAGIREQLPGKMMRSNR